MGVNLVSMGMANSSYRLRMIGELTLPLLPMPG